MLKHKLILGVAALLAGVALSGAAQANTVFGSIYKVSDAIAGDAIPANVPAGPADYTFTAPSTPLSLHSDGLYTVGEFITSGGGTLLTGNGSDTLLDTLFNITGSVSVTTGQTFTVGHDDGLTLVIGGLTVINVPGPTAFVNTTVTYTGPTGNLPFQLVYGECCGSPADLQISLPLSSVPEPSTWAMMVVGFGGLGFAAFRRSRKANVAIA
jgi:PEP-CTERM motif